MVEKWYRPIAGDLKIFFGVSEGNARDVAYESKRAGGSRRRSNFVDRVSATSSSRSIFVVLSKQYSRRDLEEIRSTRWQDSLTNRQNQHRQVLWINQKIVQAAPGSLSGKRSRFRYAVRRQHGMLFSCCQRFESKDDDATTLIEVRPEHREIGSSEPIMFPTSDAHLHRFEPKQLLDYSINSGLITPASTLLVQGINKKNRRGWNIWIIEK